jgi:signal transduction histidine kinase
MNVAKPYRTRNIEPLKPHLCTAALLALLFLTGCGTILESLKNLETENKTVALDREADQFVRSKALLAEGNYEGAYSENQKILSERRGAPDVALFNMGMVSAHPLNPRKNYPRALASFRMLVADYPQSPLTEQSKVWIQALEEHQRVGEERQKVVEEKQKLLEEKRALIREREKLSEERDKLAQERERLKYAAEKTRQVDLEIEKRRRQTLAR